MCSGLHTCYSIVNTKNRIGQEEFTFYNRQENHIDASVKDIRPQYWENENYKLFAFEFVSNLKFSLDIHRHFDYSMIKEENIYIYLHRNKNTKKSNHCFIFLKSENVKYMFCTISTL